MTLIQRLRHLFLTFLVRVCAGYKRLCFTFGYALILACKTNSIQIDAEFYIALFHTGVRGFYTPIAGVRVKGTQRNK